MDDASSLGLTGVWSGIFSFPRRYAPVEFTATLIEAGAHLSGTVHEPCAIGDNIGDTLLATVVGARDGHQVTFVKTYEPAPEWYRKPVHYDGLLSVDGLEIEGRW